MKKEKTPEQLLEENQELRIRLQEAEDTLQAIREGAVDAIVVSGPEGAKIFTLTGEEQIYRRLVETMGEAGLTTTLEGKILFCNRQFSEMLGEPMEEIVGQDLERFVRKSDRKKLAALLTKAKAEPLRKRLVFLAANGTLVPAWVAANLLEHDDCVSICLVAMDQTELEASKEAMRQIAEQREELRAQQEELMAQQEELQSQNELLRESESGLYKLNRLLKALSNSNQAMMRATDEADYLQEICKIIDNDCGYAMVWVGFAEDDQAKSVRPMACAGFEEGYLETMKITWADTPRGRGPTGTAIRTGKPRICRNVLTDPAFKPWRDEAIERGYASSIALPLVSDGRVFGSLTIYSKDPDPFSKDEVHLLTELASDLSYGITAIRARAARIAAETELFETHQRLEALMQALPVGISFSDDPTCQRITGNPAVLAQFEIGPEDNLSASAPDPNAAGRKVRFFKEGRQISDKELPLQQAVAQKQVISPMELEVVLPSGKRWFAEASGSPIYDQQGNVIGGVAMTVDITERRRYEQQLKQLTEELRRSNADLQQFAYVASHDLREPLRAITGFMDLLHRRFKDVLDEKANEYIDYAASGAKRMDELLTGLLQYSRVQTQDKPRATVPAQAALNAALENLRADIDESNAAISSDPLPSVNVDGMQFMQLLQNLLHNAIKFRSDQRPQIHVGCAKHEDGWMFSVRDNGIGIKPQYYERIFAIFQRLHPRDKYAGTGVGLSICKRIVDNLGGRIWVESQPGKGSTFYFTVPQTHATK